MFRATGIRLSELAGIRYHAEDAERSDLDLWQREITVRGKRGKAVVEMNFKAIDAALAGLSEVPIPTNGVIGPPRRASTDPRRVRQAA